MILFSSPAPKNREGSSWVPVSGELHTLGTTEPTSCGRTLGNVHIKHAGKRRGTDRAGAGWSPAKNCEWYSYQNWNTTGGGQATVSGERQWEMAKAERAWEPNSLPGRRGDSPVV